MPTPSDNTPQLSTASIIVDDISVHTTCPPEVDRLSIWRGDSPETSSSAERNGVENVPAPAASATPQSVLMRSDDESGHVHASTTNVEDPMKIETGAPGAGASSLRRSTTKSDEDSPAVGRLSPAGEPSRSSGQPSSVTSSPSISALLSYEFSNVRLLPNYTSSFLRPGSKFSGTQQSDRQVYNVDVEIKHVDMAESYLCGYLRIQGLTEDHPTLTTFFEGEIIGTKHTFKTRHEAWGATAKTDMNHWARFPAWRPLARQAKRPDFTYRDFAQRDHIFMRWKEYFLVPDHRVRTISGASFEGFYYICFNQIEGTVTGIYFHAKSEKYQQLELRHVEDRGCTPALEFR